MLEQEIEARLTAYQDPYLQTDFLTAKIARKIVVGDEVQVEVKLGYPFASIKSTMIDAIYNWLAPVIVGKKCTVQLSHQVEPHAGRQGIAGLSQVKNIIAIASGKGGVGKSTVAINLALALAREGASVGLLDADIYGPSQPLMLGVNKEKSQIKDKKFIPIIQHGLQSMSIGFLVDQQTAMVWRGPMIGKALQQMFYDTAWEALDYLIVDLPPGTGDIQLTLCQKMPVCAAVMVTTPQDLALSDVRRACAMFQQLNVPLIGVIENMSVYQCANCGHEDHIFGKEGAEKLAKEFDLSVLARLPLDKSMREMTDAGFPPVLQAPESEMAKQFGEAARKIAAKISLQRKDYSSKFPPVKVVV